MLGRPFSEAFAPMLGRPFSSALAPMLGRPWWCTDAYAGNRHHRNQFHHAGLLFRIGMIILVARMMKLSRNAKHGINIH